MLQIREIRGEKKNLRVSRVSRECFDVVKNTCRYERSVEKGEEYVEIKTKDMIIDKLIYETIGASMEVYNTLGPGLLESVYEKAMFYELSLRDLYVESHIPVEIIYKEEVISSELRLDLIVEDTLIVELKSVETLQPVHFKQLRTYMRLLDKPVGLLVNFNVSDFKHGYRVLR